MSPYDTCVCDRDGNKFKINYESNTYNIYQFLNNHPGGVNYVRPYEGKEVAQSMRRYDHSKAAYYLLKEYQLGGRKEDENDLEHLVDWDEPMLGQVGKLGPKYNEWVTSPVDRQLRLFRSDFLEYLTITPWYVVPMIWIPVIVYLAVIGTKKYIHITKDASPFIPVALSISEGILLWTLIEYSLHRWVFHIEPSGKSKLMIYFHFAIHGLHHKVPFDSRRLVFPPFPAAVITFFIYKLTSFVLSDSTHLLVIAGGLLGFGISSVFWDKIFGTALHLRKLAIGIKW
nr:unnamed protein product [Callosobruchus chinensis]